MASSSVGRASSNVAMSCRSESIMVKKYLFMDGGFDGEVDVLVEAAREVGVETLEEFRACEFRVGVGVGE